MTEGIPFSHVLGRQRDESQGTPNLGRGCAGRQSKRAILLRGFHCLVLVELDGVHSGKFRTYRG